MDMTPQTAWLIAISAVVIVGVVAFFIGRSTAGTKERIDELEAELSSKKAEVEGYRKEVEQHLDKTATLFGTSNLTAFATPENVEKVLTRFLARSQIETGVGVTSPALTLLQNASSGSSGLYNLLASR